MPQSALWILLEAVDIVRRSWSHARSFLALLWPFWLPLCHVGTKMAWLIAIVLLAGVIIAAIIGVGALLIIFGVNFCLNAQAWFFSGTQRYLRSLYCDNTPTWGRVPNSWIPCSFPQANSFQDPVQPMPIDVTQILSHYENLAESNYFCQSSALHLSEIKGASKSRALPIIS